jgi:hypothetical protein
MGGGGQNKNSPTPAGAYWDRSYQPTRAFRPDWFTLIDNSCFAYERTS